MISVTDEFKAAARSQSAQVRYKVEVAWDGIDYHDESVYFLNLDVNLPGYSVGDTSLNSLGNSGIGSLVMSNKTFRYSRFATTGDSSIRALISGDDGFYGKPVRIYAGYDNASHEDTVQIFQGYLYSGRVDPRKLHTTFEIRDNGMIALQRRISNEIDLGASVDWLINKYASAADLSLLELDSSPFIVDVAYLEDDSVLEECRKLASSVNGFLFFNNKGTLVFHTADHWIKQGVTEGRTFEARHCKAVPGVSNPDLLASTIIVDYSPRAAGTTEVLYSLDTHETIPPNNAGDPFTLTCRLSNPAIILDELIESTNYWFANTSGVDMNEYCTISYAQPGPIKAAQQVEIRVINSHPTLPATMTLLDISGVPVVGRPSRVKKKDTGYLKVKRERSTDSNFFVQTERLSTFLVNLLADRHKKLVPVWTIEAMRAWPWLEIGDHIRWMDGEEYSSYRDGYITNIHYTMSQIGAPFGANYTVVDREAFHPGADTSFRADYFYIGVDCPQGTTLKRCYY